MMTQREWETMREQIKDSLFEEFNSRLDDMQKEIETLEERVNATTTKKRSSSK